MSMIARFIAIAPTQLDEVRKSPEQVQALFEAEVPRPRLKFRQALHDRIRSQSPQVLRDSLDRMPPEMRRMMLRGLGIKETDLAGADIGDLIVKRMTERAANLVSESQQNGEPAATGISLEKAWHGLHYLLCGSAEPAPGPLGQAVFGGTEIGEDMGYGPARCFTARETSEIAEALQATGLETILIGRFNPNAMEQLGVYPGGWHAEGPDWLIDAFQKLRDFYASASAEGNAVVTALE